MSDCEHVCVTDDGDLEPHCDVDAAAAASEGDGDLELHCDDDAEVGDDLFDDCVYDTPDDLGFLAIKPGPKQRIGSSWRDATYIRIYGCASHYIKWKFKNVVRNIEYRIDLVVKNVAAENDNGDLYYKCCRLGSCSSANSYDYIKCVELMNTQKKRRIYEWIRRSLPRGKRATNRSKQQWPGWAMIDEDGNAIVT